ncbi:MAG: tetratricopeptide repeat protein [Crocinitomicaceae bacterium]
MKLHHLFFACSLFTLIACNNGNNPNALSESYFYEYEPIGWSIEVPPGYELVSTEEVTERNEKGQEKVEQLSGQDIDFVQTKDLLNFKYDEGNVFASSVEPFFEEYPGEWLDVNAFVKDLISTGYDAEGLIHEMSPDVSTIIGGIEFQTYDIIFYDEEGAIIMEQYFYNALINELSFSAYLTLTDATIKEDMINIFEASTFESTIENGEADDRLYDCIANADKAFEEERFQDAKYWYLEGMQVKPENEYVIQQLEECETELLSVQDEPSKADKMIERGHAEYVLGNFQKAQEYYERALNVDPTNLIAADRIEKIEKQIDLNE